MRAPEFWTTGRGAAPALLAPVAALYAGLASARARLARPWRAPVPVVCVGNLTVGGAGKTPTAIAIGERLIARGLRIGFLTRGYGGSARGPLQVDPRRHDAALVGDEPLLLARVAPTWIARDRRAGAEAAVIEGVEAIVMDDGLQNPALIKDLSIVVVDGAGGFGNGRLLPAGPLREPVADGLARAGAIVLVGEDRLGLAARLAAAAPLLRARFVPDAEARRLAGMRVLAFAGIARPRKFFDTLAGLGATIVASREFPDHHAYSADEIMVLVEEAALLKATPVTTAKDHVRLSAEARPMVTPVPVRLAFDDDGALDRVLAPVQAQAAARPPPG